MDNLAKQQDQVLGRLERAGNLGDCGPKLNEEKDAQYWFDQPGAPKPKLANEKEPDRTVAYDSLLQAWKEGRVR